MGYKILLVIALFSLDCVGTAGDQPKQFSFSTQPSFQFGLPIEPSADIFSTPTRLPPLFPTGIERYFPDHTVVALRNTGTCYSIRSYVVRREEPGSDATRIISYSTCQPASKYAVRNLKRSTEDNSAR